MASRLSTLLNRAPVGLRAGLAVAAVALSLASTGTGTAYFSATTGSAVNVGMADVTPSRLYWAGSAAGGASMVPDISRWTLGREATSSTTWASVATGGFHTCAVTTDGKLYCWGANSFGQLGLGDTTDRSTPARVGSGTTWASVTAGRFHTCALTTANALSCWGGNSMGQVGNNTQVAASSPQAIAVPAAPTNGSTWAKVSAGEYTTCAITNTGKGHCWGVSDLKQAGAMGAGPFKVPTLMKTPNDFTEVSVGHKHACGLNGTSALCWGAGQLYALGGGATADKDTPTAVSGAGSYKAVSAGRDLTCLITTAGNLQCVGAGYYGQTGTGTLANLDTLTQVGSSTAWTTLSAGERSVCGLAGTALFCWGANASGELGLGHADPQFSPTAVPVPGGGTWSAVSLRYNHLCAITSGGALYCAGADGYGQLGRGSTHAVPSASLAVIGAKVWTNLASSGSTTCGVAEDTTLWCWGSNASGQLGNGTTTSSAAPVQVGADIGWSRVTVGAAHACALRTSGELWCWGRNSSGQLGDGSTTDRSSPVQVSGAITNWKTVSAGGVHTCAIPASNAGVYCFGGNAVGQLGIGSTTDKNLPTKVTAGPANWETVVLGPNFACGTELAPAATGLWCWGDNRYAQLGKATAGSPKIESAPVNSGVLTTRYVSLAAGAGHACAIDYTTGTSLTYCWGTSQRGQLGKDLKAITNGPTTGPGAAPGAAFSQVFAGGDSTCAVGGTIGVPTTAVSCWGDNSAGQLGQGDFSDQPAVKTPTTTTVPGGTGAISLSLGDRTLFLMFVESSGGGPPPDLTYEQTVLASAPDGYWRLNDTTGTKAVKKSGKGDGTYQGGFTLNQTGPFGEAGKAVAFNGTDGRIDFGDKYDFKAKAKLSLELWFKRTGALKNNSWFRLLSKDRYGGESDRGGWALYLSAANDANPGIVNFSRYQGASHTDVGTLTAPAVNTWHHVVATYDGVTQKIYLDGALQASVASALSLEDSTITLTAGSASVSDFFPGLLDEIAIYNRALSDAEILAHYQAAS